MKTIRFISLIMIGVSLLAIWDGCKKGAEDPFFSIWSRKHRVVGTWKITSYQVNFVDSLRRLTLPQDSQVIYGICGLETDVNIRTYDYVWTFDKHGGYTQKLTILYDTIHDILNNTTVCEDYFAHDSTITVTVASWNFTGNIGDFKNKEQLYIYDPDTKVAQVYDIIELREKEMKLETEFVDPVSNVASLRNLTLTAQ